MDKAFLFRDESLVLILLSLAAAFLLVIPLVLGRFARCAYLALGISLHYWFCGECRGQEFCESRDKLESLFEEV